MKTNWKTIETTAAALMLSVLPAAAQAVTPLLPLTPTVATTIPANGDVNPYGVAFVPASVLSGGVLHPGDVLVSNFNNNQNLQGTGTTIVRISPNGATSLFFQGKTKLGLTAALGVLQSGLVLVGNLPTADGTSNTVQPGSLLLIDRNGNLLGTFANSTLIDGPWGMAVIDQGQSASFFISNVLNGTVIRMDVRISPDGESLAVRNVVQIATGYSHRTDPAALVLGPSGLAFDAVNDILYVANSADNTIYAIPNAAFLEGPNGTGKVVYQDAVHLHGPLDLVRAPNGHLIVANSDGSNADPNQPSELVEFTVNGQFVSQFPVDPNNGGAFGVNQANLAGVAVRTAAVDDNANTLTIWTSPIFNN